MIKKIINHNLIEILILILLIFPLIFPLLKTGMFISDDGNWMIIRLSDFHRSLRDGQFPVRWAGRLNYQYGYPVFNFLYPGVYYLGEVFHLLGFNFVNSIKILFGISIFFSAIFSYVWLKTKFSKFPALIGSVIYAYFPYHVFDIYNRGSLGEAIAISLLPLLLLSLEKKNLLIGSISFALLITSHNILSILFFPFLVFYSVIFIKPIKTSFFIFSLGISLSAFFWLPALYDRRYTVFDQIKISSWNEFFVTGNNFFLLGWGSLLIVLISLFFLIKYKEKMNLFFLIIFVISLFFSLSISTFFWQFPILPKFVQFPWRFLSLAGITISFLAAYIIEKSINKIKIFLSIIIFIIFFFSVLPIINKIKYINEQEGYYSTNEDTTTVKNEYMPVWVKNIPKSHPDNKAEIISGEGEIKLISQNSKKINIDTDIKKSSVIKINSVYFPGWQAKINGNTSRIIYNNPEGIMLLSLKPGKNNILLTWNETPIRQISDIISILSLFIILYVLIKPQIKILKTK